MHRRFGLILRAHVICVTAVVVLTCTATAATGTPLNPSSMHTVAVQPLHVQQLPVRANLLGVRWQGSTQHVAVRVLERTGRWTSWIELRPNADRPDADSSEARRARARIGGRTHVTHPLLVQGASAVQVRPDGPVRGLEVIAVVNAGVVDQNPRARSRSSSQTASLVPAIRSRSAWQAAPARTSAVIASEGVLGVVIHHTASTNAYRCSEVPAILRGIQRYHMQAQGWNDIGYNYLVDRCGRVWEGRGGGVRQNVIGAHTAGFNTGTSGIAIIGTTTAASMSTNALQAISNLVAWRLDLAHVRPTGRMLLTARSGNGRYPAGERVNVRAVSGHRDLFATDCPGDVTHRQLAAIATRAWRSGGVKVANVTARAVRRLPEHPWSADVSHVDLRAVSSVPGALMTAQLVRSSTGAVLHRVTTRRELLEHRWVVPPDLAVADWDLTLRVSAVRSRPLQRARTLTRSILAVSADPELIVTQPPASNVGAGGQLQLRYTLARAGRLGAWLVDPVTGSEVATLRAATSVAAATEPRLLTLAIPDTVPDGTYELRLALVDDEARGRSMRRSMVTVSAAS